MNRTQIEWVKNPDGSQGYTWNPMSGCLNHTDGLCKGGDFPCYAYKLANGRLKQRYLRNLHVPYPDSYVKLPTDPFYPRFWEERLRRGIFDLGRKPKGIFVCDMGELFADSIPDTWIKKILAVCAIYPQHRFYLLTKQPQNLIKWSPFPENCWVGVTATNGKMVDDAGYWLERIDAKVKFLSLEPLLEPMLLFFGKPTLDWLIIGACTGSESSLIGTRLQHLDLKVMQWGNRWTLQPKLEWVQEIVEAADKAGIRVFLKDNLEPMFKDIYDGSDFYTAKYRKGLHQEIPQT